MASKECRQKQGRFLPREGIGRTPGKRKPRRNSRVQGANLTLLLCLSPSLWVQRTITARQMQSKQVLLKYFSGFCASSQICSVHFQCMPGATITVFQVEHGLNTDARIRAMRETDEDVSDYGEGRGHHGTSPPTQSREPGGRKQGLCFEESHFLQP